MTNPDLTRQTELSRREAMSFDKDLRAWVSSRMANKVHLTPEDVARVLKEVGESWGMVNLQIRFFGGDDAA